MLSTFYQYADDILSLRYAHIVQGRKESWGDICKRVCYSILHGRVSNSEYGAVYDAMVNRLFIPGGRILSQAGRPYHQTDNCFTLRAVDTREGWADLAHKCTMMFMSGGGVGVDYTDIRSRGTTLKRSGGISSGPLPLIEMVNSIGAAARQGGDRRGAIYASLPWDHADVDSFIKMKQVDGNLQHTNISVMFNRQWQRTHNPPYSYTDSTFMHTLKHACMYGDPGFQFDSDNQTLRNACTEIVSSDDEDSCCLGSVNLSKITSMQQLADVTRLGILFLLCNTLYTDTPTSKVAAVKHKNRRLGLGLMGIGEWFIQQGVPYGDMHSIQPLLIVWKQNADIAATEYSNMLSVNRPIATRAIAPTGTISIAGGHTTPGIEPVFHTAYQRCYNTPQGLHKEVVIEPVVEKLMEQGLSVDGVDTAYTLSKVPEGIDRRIKFQAFVQGYVDNAISSTVNLPPYTHGIEEDVAPILLKYLPQLRGITFYPDGRHENQPVVPMDIKDALTARAQMDMHPSCKGGECGV